MSAIGRDISSIYNNNNNLKSQKLRANKKQLNELIKIINQNKHEIKKEGYKSDYKPPYPPGDRIDNKNDTIELLHRKLEKLRRMKPIKTGSKCDKIRRRKNKLKELYAELSELEKDNTYTI